MESPTASTSTAAAPPPSAFETLATSISWGKRRDTEDENSDEATAEDFGKSRTVPLSADPDAYLYAKRKLKRAVLEHYR